LKFDKAFAILKEAGITDNIDTFRKWVHTGKIKSIGLTIDEHSLKQFMKEYTNPDKDLIINQLKAKIHAQNNHILGIEQLHETATHTFFRQREQLNNEILLLKKENQRLQQESMELLKENIALRNQLIKLKDNASTNNQRSSVSTEPPSTLHIDKQKLGLSKMASNQEVLATYKELLKISHPDHGGNAKLFQYIKTDFDQIRKKHKK
jgi:regulator of replication initiation timing